jgi:hypothetical protein
MRLGLLLGLLLAATASAAQAVPPVGGRPAKSADVRHWYHPTGYSCPAWRYQPTAKPAADSARAACTRYAERWLKGVRCLSRSGRATPSC